MAGPYVPLVKNSAGGYVGYIALSDFATPGTFKANPTIAAGDFKVSTDGAAFANLGTLPSVEPAGGIAVKITLSQAEVNGDNIFVQCIDQTATKEWADYAFLAQPQAVQSVAQTGDAFARLGAPVGASISVDIADIPTANENADAARARQLTESYAADGAAPTLEQAIFEILQFLEERSISGTTLTVKKRDGTTTAMTFTLDSATAPASQTRST